MTAVRSAWQPLSPPASAAGAAARRAAGLLQPRASCRSEDRRSACRASALRARTPLAPLAGVRTAGPHAGQVVSLLASAPTCRPAVGTPAISPVLVQGG